ncbi:hypothetical protein GJ496_001224 [Pomphorhynchus laevis]|nr:hypothetical protein GJ496_001224 [Pomphorhynchus laevis]
MMILQHPTVCNHIKHLNLVSVAIDMPSIRHNIIRNLLADELSTVVNCVGMEPSLQAVPNFVTFEASTTAIYANACSDI